MLRDEKDKSDVVPAEDTLLPDTQVAHAETDPRNYDLIPPLTPENDKNKEDDDSHSDLLTESSSEDLSQFEGKEGKEGKEEKEKEENKVEPSSSDPYAHIFIPNLLKNVEEAVGKIMDHYLSPNDRQSQKPDETQEEKLARLSETDRAKYNRRKEQIDELQANLKYATKEWYPKGLKGSKLTELEESKLRFQAMNGAIIFTINKIFLEYTKKPIESENDIAMTQLEQLVLSIDKKEKFNCKDRFREMNVAQEEAEASLMKEKRCNLM